MAADPHRIERDRHDALARGPVSDPTFSPDPPPTRAHRQVPTGHSAVTWWSTPADCATAMAPPDASDAATRRADQIRRDERCVAGNGHDAANLRDIGRCPAHTCQDPRRGDRRNPRPRPRPPAAPAPQSASASPLALMITRPTCGAQIASDMGQHRAAAEVAQGLVPATHSLGAPAGQDHAEDRFGRRVTHGPVYRPRNAPPLPASTRRCRG